MGRMAENLHAFGCHEDLLLQLQALVLALDPHVRLHTEDHPVLDLARVVVLEGDDRVLVAKTAAVRDEGVPLRVVGGGGADGSAAPPPR